MVKLRHMRWAGRVVRLVKELNLDCPSLRLFRRQTEKKTYRGSYDVTPYCKQQIRTKVSEKHILFLHSN